MITIPFFVLLLAAIASGPGAQGAPPEEATRKPQDERPAVGRWRPFRTHKFDHQLSEKQRREIELLEAIGYVDGSVPSPDRKSVTLYAWDKAYAGLNFYTSGHAPEAILADMTGRVLHRWSRDFWEIWPEYPVSKDNRGTQHWRRAFLYANGDVLAIAEGLGIVKVNKDSELLWANPCRAHHDLQIMPNGDIYLLAREAHIVPRVDPERPILEDLVLVLDADGKEKRRLSLLECFENSVEYGFMWKRLWKRWRRDRTLARQAFHSNSLEVLDGSVAERVPAFRAGNLLISALILNAVAVVDIDQKKVVWAYQGSFIRQHDSTILSNGHLLLFDNRGTPDESAVLEYDPATMKVLWEYRGSAEHPFYSRTCGTNQRLPNGNTLITESDNGRAFEVTPDGEIVWEFYNPHRAGEHDEFIATLFAMERLEPDFPISWASGSRRRLP
ncbi:MAG: hypothetical protein GY856_40995 [bacterium]|nr:hypothetical protein [bacterium]